MLQQAADRYGRPEDYLRQGVYLGKSGDVDGAKLAFAKAIRFAPKDDATPFIALAEFYDSLGSGADALTALRQAYYVAPDNVHIAEEIRRHGMVPGPTVALEPQR
jgi:cytochrome c-type biogenesis protein CcmH/NrfG